LVGVPLFQHYNPDLHWIELWINGLLKRLVPNPPIRAEGSRAIHAAFYRQGPKQLLVQMVNNTMWTSRGLGAPLRDIDLVGRSDRFAVRSARQLWPKEQTLAITAGPQWRIRVPEVALHTIIAVQLT